VDQRFWENGFLVEKKRLKKKGRARDKRQNRVSGTDPKNQKKGADQKKKEGMTLPEGNRVSLKRCLLGQ